MRSALLAAVTLACSAIPAHAAQEDALAAAHELYASAAYEDALGSLDRLAATPAITDRQRATIDHYRALCLLALNRQDEATAAIEGMVRHDPLYAPLQADLSPRTRQLFQQVQRRVLPVVAQELYAHAKATYQAGRSEQAVQEFDKLLATLDVIAAAGDPPPLMGDLRVLATGFRQLALAAMQQAAPPAPAPPPPAATDRAPPESPGAQGTGGAAPVIQHPIVVDPPITVRQEVPPWPPDLPLPAAAVAVVEVVIGPDGRVQEARLAQSVNPRYDQLLLAASKRWIYRPALRDGQPTPFVKVVRVELPARP